MAGFVVMISTGKAIAACFGIAGGCQGKLFAFDKWRFAWVFWPFWFLVCFFCV
jgi:hypothetical protein